jgi:hypothetical protein
MLDNGFDFIQFDDSTPNAKHLTPNTKPQTTTIYT